MDFKKVQECVKSSSILKKEVQEFSKKFTDFGRKKSAYSTNGRKFKRSSRVLQKNFMNLEKVLALKKKKRNKI